MFALSDPRRDLSRERGLRDLDASAAPAERDGPALFTAVQKLGLKLEQAKGSAEFLAIDHVEKPSEN